MGYARYDLNGMERGYAVPDVCHAPGCTKEIDRGLSYLCYGCELYFCDAHLCHSDQRFDCFAGEGGQACAPCINSAADPLARREGSR